MPKVRCSCGNIMGLGQIPSPNQLLIMSDKDYDEISYGSIDPEVLYDKFNIVAKCDICGRLLIFWDGFDKDPAIYKPE